MRILFFLFFSLPISVNAQTFFVHGEDFKSRDHVIERIRFEGYKVIPDSSSADYTVLMKTDGKYKVVSFKKPYSGYIQIIDKKGNEVAKTNSVKGTPTAFNGYNASLSIYEKICKRYLVQELKKCQTTVSVN